MPQAWAGPASAGDKGGQRGPEPPEGGASAACGDPGPTATGGRALPATWGNGTWVLPESPQEGTRRPTPPVTRRDPGLRTRREKSRAVCAAACAGRPLRTRTWHLRLADHSAHAAPGPARVLGTQGCTKTDRHPPAVGAMEVHADHAPLPVVGAAGTPFLRRLLESSVGPHVPQAGRGLQGRGSGSRC